MVAISRGRDRARRGDLHQVADPLERRLGRRDRRALRFRSGTIPSPRWCWSSTANGRPRGAALGNDVNLRDFEGRSALLLGKAKDNNASCAIGPFIRLFDDGFTMDDVRTAELELVIDGPEGYRLTGASSMREISRDPEELVRQARSEHHYPDGFALFLGTLFAPVQDRDEPGRGFTHKLGDLVRITLAKARHAGQPGDDVEGGAALAVRRARSDAQSRRRGD